MQRIKMLVMDVDGTLTDGKIYLSSDGEIMKVFNIKDGYGIKEVLPEYNVLPVIITGRISEIVQKRCEELEIKYVYQGVKDKLACLAEITGKQRLTYEKVAYIGDDDNDLQVMKKIGVVGCPSDSSENVKRVAHFVASKNGGDGAVREFIDWLVANGYFT